MSAPLHVLLGAHGDLCAMLPFLKREADRSGAPVPLFVAEAYAPVLEGVSYVVPVPFKGEWRNLGAALKYLRETCPDVPVKLMQFYQSRQDAVMRSFLDEMWYQAGAWKGWEEHPLVFDRRNPAREEELVRKVLREGCKDDKMQRCKEEERPLILVAPHGSRHSMPFQDAASLMKLVRRDFGKTCHIVNLSRVKAHRVYDLLALYERAAALISVDTVHLHLSRAVPTLPVFALVRDHPTLWHGTPWQARFAMHVRYRDVLKRWSEITEKLQRCQDAKMQSWKGPSLEIVAEKGQYNPGMFEWGLKRRFVTRKHRRWKGKRSWRTDLMIGEHQVMMPRNWRGHSHEDVRVFCRGGMLHVSFTLATATKSGRPRCVQAYGQLWRFQGHGWGIKSVVVPRFGRNDFTFTEKNWVFFSHEDRVHAIYACHPRHIVIALDGEKVIQKWSTPGPRWAWGQIRGGTSPVHFRDGLWLRFFHSRTEDPRKGVLLKQRYHVGALIMESRPPFRVLAVSRAPIWSGDERPVPGVWHWKPNVIIPYGCIEADPIRNPQSAIRNPQWIVSLGVNDALACTARVGVADLKIDWEQLDGMREERS